MLMLEVGHGKTALIKKVDKDMFSDYNLSKAQHIIELLCTYRGETEIFLMNKA